jgi:sugar-specific transcriptional regulator TrmB
MIEPRIILSQLELSEAEIDVYLAMLHGARAARDIVQITSRSRPTVYYALNSLEQRGLLSKTGLEEDQRFRVEPLERLQTIIHGRQAELKKTASEVDRLVRQFQQGSKGDRRPQVSFYEGVAGVRNVIMETMYCHGRQIDSLVPTQNFFLQLEPAFVTRYVEMRHDMGVRTRSLWGAPIEPAIVQQYYDISEIRMMPKTLGSRFRSTIFMYDHSVLYISSLASGYALLVSSAEHYELMQALYGTVWASSKPLKP